MPNDERERAMAGAETLQNFFTQFGDDVHAQILLDVLINGIKNEETLFVFGEPQQKRDEVDHSPSRGLDGIIPSERPDKS